MELARRPFEDRWLGTFAKISRCSEKNIKKRGCLARGNALGVIGLVRAKGCDLGVRVLVDVG